MIKTLEELKDVLRSEIVRAHEYQPKMTNRREVPDPAFESDDVISLKAKNIPIQRHAIRLDNRRLGPFPITESIASLAYGLELPAAMKIHPVFHVSLLQLTTNCKGGAQYGTK